MNRDRSCNSPLHRSCHKGFLSVSCQVNPYHLLPQDLSRDFFIFSTLSTSSGTTTLNSRGIEKIALNLSHKNKERSWRQRSTPHRIGRQTVRCSSPTRRAEHRRHLDTMVPATVSFLELVTRSGKDERVHAILYWT